MGVLSGLKPEKVFYYFEELCKIPHGSYHTKQISDYLVQFAKERNLECSQDDSNNVVIRKAAFAGYEDAPVVILQGHCDMVCEKTADSTHDFEKDGLDHRSGKMECRETEPLQPGFGTEKRRCDKRSDTD